MAILLNLVKSCMVRHKLNTLFVNLLSPIEVIKLNQCHNCHNSQLVSSPKHSSSIVLTLITLYHVTGSPIVKA